MKFLPEVMKSLRKSKGYSLGTVVRLLQVRFGYSVTRSCISHWENGKARPSLESLMILAELYEVDIKRFFTEEECDHEHEAISNLPSA